MGWDIAIPLIAAGVGVGGSMYSADQQSRAASNLADENYQRQIEFQNRQIANQLESENRQKAWITSQQDAQKQAWDKQQAYNEAQYQKYAYPKAEEIEAKRSQMNADWGNERSKRLDALARNASLRGWGSGSGALGAASGQIEADYLNALGKANNELTQYANKAQFAYPFSSGYGFSPMQYGTGQGLSGYNSGFNWGNGYNNSGENFFSQLAGAGLNYGMDKLLKNNNTPATSPTILQEQMFSNWGI